MNMIIYDYDFKLVELPRLALRLLPEKPMLGFPVVDGQMTTKCCFPLWMLNRKRLHLGEGRWHNLSIFPFGLGHLLYGHKAETVPSTLAQPTWSPHLAQTQANFASQVKPQPRPEGGTSVFLLFGSFWKGDFGFLLLRRALLGWVQPS